MKLLFTLFALLAAAPVIDVPEGDGDPVLVDGVFSPGEWDDAREIEMGDSASLFVKQYRGHVYLFVKTPWSMLSTADVYIQTEPGVIHQLHASAQLGERTLTDTLWTDWQPAWHWGNARDWYANENRFDPVQADSILKLNPQLDRRELRVRTLYHYDGYEYQVRRSKFPAKQWRIRVVAHATAPNQADRIYPADSDRLRPDTWATLRFR